MKHLGDPKMGKAYRAARELLGAELSNDEREILRRLEERDVVVIKGEFDRVEDVNLGWEWFLEAGPSLESLGATRDGA